MAPPTDNDKSQLRQGLLDLLSRTSFACSSLEPLTNGTTNFVFRGRLVKPLEGRAEEQLNGSTTVIVKHSTAYAAVNKDLALDISRSIVEQSMLQALNSFSPRDAGRDADAEAKSPRLFWSDTASHTLVIENLVGAVDLKTVLLPLSSALPAPRLDQVQATSVGQALGQWLRAFHCWTASFSSSSSSSSSSFPSLPENEPMRQLKWKITYGAFLDIFENFPAILQGEAGRKRREVLEAVQAMAADEFARQDKWPDRHEGIIHGDFWTGNILLSRDSHATRVSIVDWEFVQHGHRAYDVGQLVGDLLERRHLRGADSSATHILDGFLAGYFGFPRDGGSQEDDNDRDDALAFRTAIHAGVQLAGCYIRRAPDGPLPGKTPEQLAAAMELAAELIVRGWQKDRAWLESSELSRLLKRG